MYAVAFLHLLFANSENAGRPVTLSEEVTVTSLVEIGSNIWVGASNSWLFVLDSKVCPKKTYKMSILLSILDRTNHHRSETGIESCIA